ncbi:hypothetical protein M0R45_029567 [Rubus argutus]|uniref:Uncharacterized protein n=1 Tax=Rubus argutus TaxID=59490 RepID=A0AAW1WCD5_RUBAR
MSILKRSMVLVALVFTLFVTTSHSIEPFQYYQFAVAYGKGVCYKNDLCKKQNPFEYPVGWTIHGLWPSNYSTSTNKDVSCSKNAQHNDVHFNLHNLGSVMVNRLLEVWPNLYEGKSDVDLWENEYEKHGTCLQPDPAYNEATYFGKTLELFELYDVFDTLEGNNIRPRPVKISANIILTALKNIVGEKKPRITCREIKNEVPVLTQIAICLDLELKNFVDCGKKSNCLLFANPDEGKKIIYV